MRKRKSNRTLTKRAVDTGLFLGILCTLCGCVRPAVQPTGTPEPTREISGGITQSPIGETTPVPTATQPPEGPTGQVLPKPTPETETPIGRPTPALPTGEPEISPTPVTGGAVSITPTVTPELTPTEKPVTTKAPDQPSVPTPTATPEPTPTPGLTLTPELPLETTPTPKPTLEPTLTPEPTLAVQPDYETLIQNGWQRTEDFFGNREIYFSGMFKQTELLTAPGRYEYRYTTRPDADVVFSVIGEELPVQSYLDELTQKGTNCVITQEAEEEYSYQYTEKEQLVAGRIYACVEGEKEYRMRIEISYPVSIGLQTEQYEFYLK